VAIIDNTSSSPLCVRDDERERCPGARGLLFLLLGGIDDLAKAASQYTPPELAPPMPPPSFLKLTSTSSNLICFRTATPVVSGWTLECVVENDTGRAKLRGPLMTSKGSPRWPSAVLVS